MRREFKLETRPKTQIIDITPHQTVNKNAPSHIKGALIGELKTVFIGGGKLLLGQYQSIHVWEFDEPRSRQVWLRIVAD